jgi:hypothetical protein
MQIQTLIKKKTTGAIIKICINTHSFHRSKGKKIVDADIDVQHPRNYSNVTTKKKP